MSIFTATGESRPAGPDELANARIALDAEKARVAALSLFARRMSHDMSNFVTVVRTYSELLLADLPSGGTRDDVLEIHRAADAMIEYMQRIARFARASSGRLATVLLDDVVIDVVRNAPAVHRVHDALASEATVRMDSQWLADSVRELLANAREASPPNGETSVRSWCEVLSQPVVDGGVPIDAGTWAVLEVSDAGSGFAGDAGRQSLDPFVTSKVGVRGAGFGLALARGAAWHAGGHLVLDTDGEARPGGRVRMWLPAELSGAS